MSEQDVVKFCEITGASIEVANNFLEIADHDFETAVTLFLENGGGDMHTSEPSTEQHPTSDEDLARQLQEQDQVRAPIAPMTDILTGGSPSSFQSSPLWSTRRRDNVRPSVFNQGDSTTGSVTDFLSRLQPDITPSHSSAGSVGSDSPTSAKARRLADLFRPPFDIMYRGSFEEARDTAKENDQWLMVNIQDPTEFSCQVLNRDLWSDSFIKDIIKGSFIFLQYTNTSPEGTRYSTLYQVRRYPHIAIIDARTGERVKVWEKELPPTDFMMEVTEFLDRHSTATVETNRHLSDMTEEEQLNAAIAASLTRSEEPVIEAEEEEEEAGSAFDAIKPVKREETTDMTNSTRIQLRMGDGSRVIRRFLKTDPVRYIFEYVKAEIPGANEQPFELIFNRTQLIDLLDQTIAEAGLSNAAVNCTFV